MYFDWRVWPVVWLAVAATLLGGAIWALLTAAASHEEAPFHLLFAITLAVSGTVALVGAIGCVVWRPRA